MNLIASVLSLKYSPNFFLFELFQKSLYLSAFSFRQLQARCICRVSDGKTTSRYAKLNCTASIC